MTSPPQVGPSGLHRARLGAQTHRGTIPITRGPRTAHTRDSGLAPLAAGVSLPAAVTPLRPLMEVSLRPLTSVIPPDFVNAKGGRRHRNREARVNSATRDWSRDSGNTPGRSGSSHSAAPSPKHGAAAEKVFGGAAT